MGVIPILWIFGDATEEHQTLVPLAAEEQTIQMQLEKM